MQITRLPNPQIPAILRAQLGFEPTSTEGIAELLRCEVTARGSAARHLTIARIARMVAPAATLEAAQIADVCEQLEDEGDVRVGTGGILFASPVRAIKLSGTLYRVVTSLPSAMLNSVLPGHWSHVGIRRECDTPPDLASEAIHALGGVLLSPTQWAQLDRYPIANQSLLNALNARLHANPSGPLTEDHGKRLDWIVCEISANHPLRYRNDPDSNGQLWRARNNWGWISRWTLGGSPAKTNAITLSNDEATRAGYAFSVCAGVPVQATLSSAADESCLTVDGWIPGAEYRYLSMLAHKSELVNKRRVWTLRATAVDEVKKTLADRLGIAFRG